MKDLIQKLSDVGFDKLENSEKDTLKKYYNESDINEISNKQWKNTSEATKSRVRDIFNNKSFFDKAYDKISNLPTTVTKAIFPRLSQSSGENFGSDVAKASLDVMSLPGRFGAGTIGGMRQVASGEFPTPLLNIGLTESDRNEEVAPDYIKNKFPEQYYDVTKNVANFVEDVQRSPFTVIPTVGKAGSELLSFAPKLGQVLLEKTPAIVQATGRLGAEAATLPALMNVDRYAKEEPTTGKQVEDELITGLVLGAIPAGRQFATVLQDKRTGANIGKELLRGSRTSTPMTTGSLDADTKLRQGMKSMYGVLFDDTKSTRENAINIIRTLENSHPETPLRSSLPALRNISGVLEQEPAKKAIDMVDLGLASVTGGASLPVTVARKIAGNTQRYYDRSGDYIKDVPLLGRTLYKAASDITNTQQNRERR